LVSKTSASRRVYPDKRKDDGMKEAPEKKRKGETDRCLGLAKKRGTSEVNRTNCGSGWEKTT